MTVESVLQTGLEIKRVFTQDGVDPFDTVEWGKYRIEIKSEHTGEIVFEKDDCEFPVNWSERARTIFAEKFFQLGEISLKESINRVVCQIAEWGGSGKYFDSNSFWIFIDELKYLIIHQYCSWNSPVWFNVGISQKPQTSACFINSVDDDMDSISELSKIENRIFKYGSGSGANVSNLRANGESLSKGGTSSGPLQFMRYWDSGAGVIRSGGIHRRSAKMVVLDDDHPDVYYGQDEKDDFIWCKAEQERIGKLIHEFAGLPLDFNAKNSVYDHILYQNGNHSVRISDEFMGAVMSEGIWKTTYRTTGEVARELDACAMIDKIAQATWECGDPGIQFKDTINKWNTVKESGEIRASNPCSELLFIDWSACNLASINLMKFQDSHRDKFLHVIRLLIISQDILIDNSSYPDERIRENSINFRPLGLGYTNLGALLMKKQLPYDSLMASDFAALITSTMTAQAYLTSIELAKILRPFKEFEKNKNCMMNVINAHYHQLTDVGVNVGLWGDTIEIWNKVVDQGRKFGFRNAQTTLLAPTGTISFIMDCDSTGIEPLLSPVVHKKLAGEGEMEIRATVVDEVLQDLGYESLQDVKGKDLPIFDCAFGERYISPLGHINMLAAVQPFLSGGISKTINVPEHYSWQQIRDLYIESWRRGLKAVAIYRNNSKGSQPLRTEKVQEKKEIVKGVREELPRDRMSFTHKLEIGHFKGYLQKSFYPDGRLGEIFVFTPKEGSTLSGLMRAFGKAVSYLLQHGADAKFLCSHFLFDKFEPSGMTRNPQIPFCDSIVDYIFRHIAFEHLQPEEWEELGIKPRNSDDSESKAIMRESMENYSKLYLGVKEINGNSKMNFEAPIGVCDVCGGTTYPMGSCEVCNKCGKTSGCS